MTRTDVILYAILFMQVAQYLKPTSKAAGFFYFAAMAYLILSVAL